MGGLEKRRHRNKQQRETSEINDASSATSAVTDARMVDSKLIVIESISSPLLMHRFSPAMANQTSSVGENVDRCHFFN